MMWLKNHLSRKHRNGRSKKNAKPIFIKNFIEVVLLKVCGEYKLIRKRLEIKKYQNFKHGERK